MTAAKDRTGCGYSFQGRRAKELAARLKALKREQEMTGRISLFDVGAEK